MDTEDYQLCWQNALLLNVGHSHFLCISSVIESRGRREHLRLADTHPYSRLPSFLDQDWGSSRQDSFTNVNTVAEGVSINSVCSSFGSALRDLLQSSALLCLWSESETGWGREGSQAESSMNNTRSGVSASHSVFPKQPLNVHCKCPCLNCDMRETPDIWRNL